MKKMATKKEEVSSRDTCIVIAAVLVTALLAAFFTGYEKAEDKYLAFPCGEQK